MEHLLINVLCMHYCFVNHQKQGMESSQTSPLFYACTIASILKYYCFVKNSLLNSLFSTKFGVYSPHLKKCLLWLYIVVK